MTALHRMPPVYVNQYVICYLIYSLERENVFEMNMHLRNINVIYVELQE